MRLVERSGGEWCGSSYMYGSLDDSTDSFMFWGNAGSDQINVCDHWAGPNDPPSTSDCLTKSTGVNAGRADGRAGIDSIYGSPYKDELYGGDAGDHIYSWGGKDYVIGGYGSDYLFVGEDCDYVDAGTDVGGGDYDYCNCGPYANDAQAWNCEWTYNCGTCTYPMSPAYDDSAEACTSGADAADGGTAPDASQ
jgi:Ca2+-binding RTX toxin-like protein